MFFWKLRMTTGTFSDSAELYFCLIYLVLSFQEMESSNRVQGIWIYCVWSCTHKIKKVSALGINRLLPTTVQCSGLKLFASFKHFPFFLSKLCSVGRDQFSPGSGSLAYLLDSCCPNAFFHLHSDSFSWFLFLVWYPVCHISLLRHRGDWKKTPWFEENLQKR